MSYVLKRRADGKYLRHRNCGYGDSIADGAARFGTVAEAVWERVHQLQSRKTMAVKYVGPKRVPKPVAVDTIHARVEDGRLVNTRPIEFNIENAGELLPGWSDDWRDRLAKIASVVVGLPAAHHVATSTKETAQKDGECG